MTKSNLLTAYKKANKIRRSRIVDLAGFPDEATYLSYLLHESGEVTTDTPDTNTGENGTDVVIVFDTTGSMAQYIGNVKRTATYATLEKVSKRIID